MIQETTQQQLQHNLDILDRFLLFSIFNSILNLRTAGLRHAIKSSYNSPRPLRTPQTQIRTLTKHKIT